MTKAEDSKDGKEQLEGAKGKKVLTPHGHGPTGYRIQSHKQP